MARKNDLSSEVKVFIVQRLACWDSPSQVVKAVKDEFGLELTRQAIHAYDPTAKAGQRLSAKFKRLFEEARKQFTEQISAIGITHRAVRLKTFDRARVYFEQHNNFIGAADMCERAAKELGGFFTNKHQHEMSGRIGGAVQIIGSNMTAKEAAALYEREITSTVIMLPDNGRGDVGALPAAYGATLHSEG
jgi:hypothetical protein